MAGRRQAPKKKSPHTKAKAPKPKTPSTYNKRCQLMAKSIATPSGRTNLAPKPISDPSQPRERRDFVVPYATARAAMFRNGQIAAAKVVEWQSDVINYEFFDIFSYEEARGTYVPPDDEIDFEVEAVEVEDE